ncbi:MAG: hypothetical protein U0234_20130 [Sandaracinus sp.]
MLDAQVSRSEPAWVPARPLARGLLSLAVIAILLAACGGSPTSSDASALDTGVHVEPGPGEPGGPCGAGVACATGTECASTRCVSCGAFGQRPCASGCREGALRYGVCFDETAPSGTLGGICLLEDCTPGNCTVPDGTNFVCFACGQAPGQPCCPVVGCEGALTCTDDVCH